MERKVSTDALEIGMYVVRLDRPWLDTPFLFQGFRIGDVDDLRALRRHCDFVYVDDARKREPIEIDYSRFRPLGLRGQGHARVAGMPRDLVEYPDLSALEEELPHARDAKKQLDAVVSGVMEAIRAGKHLDLRPLDETVTEMIESVIRNPDALMWLTKLRHADSYAYDHAIDTSVLCVMFGRHLGLPRAVLQELGLAGLLFDVGKLRLPPELLSKPGNLTEAEFEQVKRHVEHSVAILEETPGMPENVIHGVRTHHERYNGRGYPDGLVGDQIPLFGRMIAIVDCFDAITSTRPFRPSVAAPYALNQMYDWRGSEFQAELFEQFIQALGVYPTGTIVELTSGEIGIVVAQNRTRRLRPRVMMVLDEHKVALPRKSILDLAEFNKERRERPLEIAHSHETGAFGIDPNLYYA